MKNIIENNYVVQRLFDNIHDGFISKKYLSKEEAQSIASAKDRRYLTSFDAVEHLSLLGIVPFNQGRAYIFNKMPSNKGSDIVPITGRTYEDLMNCYVFTTIEISKKELDSLEKEYLERGGEIFDKYHSFSNEILRPEREARRKEFRTEMVETIFKHGFREIGKNKWGNNKGIYIRESKTGYSCFNWPSYKSHIDMEETPFFQKVLIGSIFGKYLKNINQLDGNTFNIPCQKGNSGYRFTCFNIEFLTIGL